MIIRYSDLKKKDVINVETGKILGKVIDLSFDDKSGRILTITVPGKKNSFLSCESEELNFECITKFGDDAILYKRSKPKKEKDCACNDECNNGCLDFCNDGCDNRARFNCEDE